MADVKPVDTPVVTDTPKVESDPAPAEAAPAPPTTAPEEAPAASEPVAVDEVKEEPKPIYEGWLEFKPHGLSIQ